MNKYEIMFIVRPDMEEAEIKNTAESMKKVLTDAKAKVLDEKAMGQKELAYEINKHKTGYYFLINVESDSKAIYEFDRVATLSEDIIRHIAVKLEK